jgi:Cu2+-exporting ATPase
LSGVPPQIAESLPRAGAVHAVIARLGPGAGLGRASSSAAGEDSVCVHCGLPAPSGRRFCCLGCAAAFETIQTLGLGRYYRQRVLDPALRPPRPDITPRLDLARHVATRADGTHELALAIDGLQCGACVWLIESVLAQEAAVQTGRVNMTTRRLRLVWRGAAEDAERLVGRIEALGYRLVPFDTAALATSSDQTGRALLCALAVAGFAAGNVMLISIGIWAGEGAGWLHDMGPATRDLLHWVSALIALPAIAYAGRPFFISAITALRHGRTNMDVPISLGVVLVTGMSLAQTIAGGEYTYFDSAAALLFFLLIGRVLDHRARGQARATAEQLLTLRGTDVSVLAPDGSVMQRAQHTVVPGDRILVGLGERIGADGTVEHGASSLDASLVTGESLPVAAASGTAVFAGTLNLGAPLTVRATACGDGTLLADCVRLIEAAESRRFRYVVLADRVARRYAPAVHLTALATFAWWFFVAGAGAEQALLTASAVLIVTCPCAVALAVPAVQVIATSRLLRAGVLLKSATALERLTAVDTVVFDKTGTLTRPTLGLAHDADPQALAIAASLAVHSRHPLARALLDAAGPVAPAEGVTEHAGQGLSAGGVRLGSRRFCEAAERSRIGMIGGIGMIGMITVPPPLVGGGQGEGGLLSPASPTSPAPPTSSISSSTSSIASAASPELWLTRPDQPLVRFAFVETLRPDAVAIIGALQSRGLTVRIISGDHPGSVANIAAALGVADWQAECTPPRKVAAIEALRASGRTVLMVGDGLNDGPSLAAANVSASPATAADISQTVADAVFQGDGLQPIALLLSTARRARAVMRGNLTLALGYNALMVPLAVAGFVTPWLAAAAMSSSSLLVMANSLRLRGDRA